MSGKQLQRLEEDVTVIFRIRTEHAAASQLRDRVAQLLPPLPPLLRTAHTRLQDNAQGALRTGGAHTSGRLWIRARVGSSALLGLS